MSVFEDYHRVRDRRLFWARLPVALVAVSLVLGVGWSAAAAVLSPPAPTTGSVVVAPTPSATPAAESASVLPVDAGLVADADAGASGGETPEPGETGTDAASPPAPTAVVDPDPADDTLASWFVDVGTSGHQAEVDQCQWVRMDVGASAPIAGAHNDCGGGIVLDMAIGDTVTLVGEGLDGVYRVTDEGAGSGGQNAAEATAGLTADVILQTCFLGGGGHARLLALTQIPAPTDPPADPPAA